MVVISGAVEGDMDEVVLHALIRGVGAQSGTIYGKRGKDHLKQQLIPYNKAAVHSPWCILLDLDQDAACAPALYTTLLSEPYVPGMCLQIVVHAVEAWLMADRERLSSFLAVAVKHIPPDVESITNPKETMVNLARRSRRRVIQQDMVPRTGSGRAVGPAYTARLIEFVIDQDAGWRPLVAAEYADSLQRCLNCLRRLVERYGNG